MDGSILETIKKLLGIAPDYTAFDTDIIVGINAAFSTLHQVGVGPADGFAIYDATATWHEFTGGDPGLNSVQTYVHLQCKLVFDPPATSFATDAYKKLIEQLEWRLNVHADTTYDLQPAVLVVDGGSP